MQNYDYEHAFLCILNFYTFLSSFQSCFLHIGIAWIMSSLLNSSISISAGQNRPRALWGEPKKNEYRDMNEGRWCVCVCIWFGGSVSMHICVLRGSILVGQEDAPCMLPGDLSLAAT